MRTRKSFILSLLFICSCLGEREHQSLPPSYTPCEGSHGWYAGKFHTNIPSIRPHNADNEIIVSNSLTSNQSGYESHINSSFKPEETCSNIKNHLFGSSYIADRELHQSFDYENVRELIKSNPNFQAIGTKKALISNLFYRYDKNALNFLSFIYKVDLPVTVECENSWQMQPDSSSFERTIFKQPAGKCFFSLVDHELTLPSGQKILLALNGFYEFDAKYPDATLVIEITKHGYKRKA